jgi:mannosyltransferase PIG-V
MKSNLGFGLVPAYVKVMDALIVSASIAACALLVFGPFRTPSMTVRWTHVVFAALALALVRHVAVPSPALPSTIQGWSSAIAARPALADALLAFALTRPAVLLIGFLAGATIGLVPGAPSSGPRTLLRDLPARFDASWYAGIAADGYEWQGRFDRQQNFAFFPAFPLTMTAAGVLTGAYAGGISQERRISRFAWAGLIVALLSFVGAAVYLSGVAREFLTPDRARAAVLLISAYPFALFFSAAYTESLFLLAALGAWYHVRRHENGRAALWGLLAGLTRPNGCLLSVPLGLLALGLADAPGTNTPNRPRAAPGVIRRLAVASMPGVGMLLYTLYLHSRTGVWFGWARIQVAWGRVLGTESATPADLSAGLFQFASEHPYTALNAIGLGFALALIWPVWRRLGAAWVAYVAINVGPPLVAGGLLSMGRLSSTLFPLFLALAAVLPSRIWPAVAVAFGLLQGFLAALFYTWRDLY